MNVVVTGSIAFDYIMSFPGHFREHFLPDQLNNISLSFLVDSMKKQRGGCAANIAYNLALLGERPLLMATAGQDFGEYRKWLEQHGATFQVGKGSHLKVFLNGKQSTLPMHGTEELGKGLEAAIKRQLGLK